MTEGHTESGSMQFRLYIADGSPNSRQALANFEALRERYFPAELMYELEVIDILEAPERAVADHVLVTPTLIKLSPPGHRVVGNLSDTAAVLLAFFGETFGMERARPPRLSLPNGQIRMLVQQLAQVESSLDALIGREADAVIQPELGTPVLLREAQEALKRSEMRYRQLAHHDNLTGLPNRLLFTGRLEHAIARAARNRSSLALFYLDVDRFKSINDNLGHRAGDEVLLEFGRRLRDCVRDVDTVARVGGDEFAVLVEETGRPEDLRRLALKFIDAITAPMHVEGQIVHTSTSIGIALLPQDADGVERLLEAADEAMYRAKAKGRGSYEFFSARLNADAGMVESLEAELAEALRKGEFELHYQPVVELAGGRIVAMEALLRWRHPGQGLLLPEAFLTAAENTGAMERLGDWVMQAACRQAYLWHRAGHPVRLAINLCARELGRSDLAERFGAIYRELGLAAGELALEIEIPERLLSAARRNAQVLQALPALGIGLAIDHFGHGYASLAALAELPLTRLKVDPELFEQPDSASVQSVLRGLIALGHGLGLPVAAGGVETPAQLAALRPGQCDEAQGFLIARPLPGEAAGALLAQGLPLQH